MSGGGAGDAGVGGDGMNGGEVNGGDINGGGMSADDISGGDISGGGAPTGEASQKERMLAGELYRANDPELLADHAAAQALVAEFNAIRADDLLGLRCVLADLLGHLGRDTIVKPAFRCDYGRHISLGDRTFVNYDCVFLDCNTITIGADVQIAPGVHLYTATHPLDGPTRRAGWESAHPIVIEDGVWLGGRTLVGPGVTIGRDTVVGAGSVVVKDLPPGVLAVGNPCRVLRPL